MFEKSTVTATLTMSAQELLRYKALLNFAEGFTTKQLEATSLRELVGAVNAYLDYDGSRGCFDATELGGAKDRLNSLLDPFKESR